ncbi:MAG: carboxylating nicotinate-nucleotide diphosphorylase [Candidatus Eisenbacteria bacterium]
MKKRLEAIAAPMVKLALVEDMGGGDITTMSVVPERLHGAASILAKEEGVLAGLDVAALVFRELDGAIEFTAHTKDGGRLSPGTRICTVGGQARAILSGERVALNFLQRLSGVATLTAQFVKRVEGTGARITDTRKTTPGLRILEKYAVRVGGGTSHRFGLFDMYLVKEIHAKAAGGITAAVRLVRDARGTSSASEIQIEVEVQTPEQTQEACRCGVNRILLDNMSLDEIKECAELIRRHREQKRSRATTEEEAAEPWIEVSGGVTLENVRDAAEAGADFISVGSLTHSFKSVDMSLLMEDIGS